MGPIGVQEMIAIFLVALVLFGPKKLPELGRTIAKAITEFRRASNDLKATFEREMQSLERESESIKDVMHPIASEIQSHANFDYPYYDSGSYGTDSYDSTATNPSTVGALEAPSAESHGAIEAAPHQVEGTVPRLAAAPHTDLQVIDVAASHVETTPAPETSQHNS
ncbi:MAG: twin-arginine translocase TatA/TatE family subunit [Bryobacteraceae bacterium]